MIDRQGDKTELSNCPIRFSMGSGLGFCSLHALFSRVLSQLASADHSFFVKNVWDAHQLNV